MVVLQADRVTDLVRDAPLEELAHQRIGEGNRPCAGIDLSGLREVPRLHQRYEVVKDARRAVEDFTGARIAHVRTDGVFDGRREPSHHRVADVLGRPVGIIRRHLAGNDGVLEAGCLERWLPIENRLTNVRLPLLRRRRIDVVHDRLLRIAEVSFVPVRALESPARDVFLVDRALVTRSEVGRANAEEADSLVGASRRHRLLRQPNDAPVRDDALRLLGRCRRAAAAPRRRRGTSDSRLRRLDFDIFREGRCPFYVRAVRVDRPANRRDLRHVRGEETRHVDDGGAIRTIGLDVQDGNDRPVVRVLDGAVHTE